MAQKYNISIDNENFFQKIRIVNRKFIQNNGKNLPEALLALLGNLVH